MNVAEVMTRRVLTVQDEATLDDAIRLMLNHRISGVPVLDNTGAVEGMLTEGDLLRRTETGTERKRPRWLEFLLGPGKLADEYVHTHSRRVKDVMTRAVISVAPDTPLENLVRLMERHHIKRVPVLDGGRLVGIVSRANLLQALAMVAHTVPASAASDEEIRTRLWDELGKTEWAPRALLNIAVRDGVVHLSGTVTDGRLHDALRTAAENIPGVRLVHSHLVSTDALSGTVIDLPEEETPPPRGKTT